MDVELNSMLIEIAVFIVGAIWTYAKSHALYKERVAAKWGHAVQMMEVAVEDTYQNYVKDVKAARADGKLTAAEAMEARNRAKTRAIQIARNEGVDLIKTIGDDYLDVLISKIVKQAKQPSSWPTISTDDGDEGEAS